MKRLVLIIVLFLFFLPNILAIANPAAEFCLGQGNEYEKRVDSDGNEFGVCVIDGVEKEEWTVYNENLPLPQRIKSLGKEPSLGYFQSSSNSGNNQKSLESKSGLIINNGSSAPSSFDWRNNGGNWVSPVKDQGSCGGCWAFTANSVMESRVKLDLSNASYSVDLSEQDVITNNGQGGSCNGGYTNYSFIYAKDIGLVKESCMVMGSPSKCANWENEKMMITNYTKISANANSIKNAIATYGQITAYMIVCGGFGGTEVYSHSEDVYYDGSCYSDGLNCYEGLCDPNMHAVSIVGYDDTNQYWIIKNSWGTGWGEEGYLRINYSQSVYNWSTWVISVLSPAGDSRVFFLDESYYVDGTDITTIPTINTAQANNTYSKSATPIDFSVYAIPKSIKQLSSVKINGTSMNGSLQYGGIFSITKTPAQLECTQGSEAICNLTITAVDDAGISNATSTSILVDDLAPRYSSNNYSFIDHINFTTNITLSDSLIQYAWVESNLSGALQNYTYFLNSSNEFLSKNFNATTTNRSFSFRWGINDSVGNYNFTEWISLSVTNNPPTNLSIPNINWTVNSNHTLNLKSYFFDIDLDSLVFSSTDIANVSTSINQTTGIITFFPDGNFTGTRTFQVIANDSLNWTYSNNITLEVFRPIINFSTFNGLTTNFSKLNYFLGLDLVFEKNSSGRINFSGISLNLTNLDFDNNINISENFIGINSSVLSILNTSAIITMYNLSFSTPIIYKDWQVCPTNLCTQLSYTSNTLVFNVSSFSNYTTKEYFCGDTVCSSSEGETCSTCSTDCGACPAPSSSSSSSGGGGGGATDGWLLNKKTTENQLCLGYNVELGKNQRVQFNISNEIHYVGIKNITGDNVLIEIASDPRTEILSINETKSFEITHDDYYDLQITLNSIIGGRANLTLNRVYEGMAKNLTAPSEEINRIQEGESSSPTDASPSSTNRKIMILSIVAIIVIFVFIKLFLDKLAKKKEIKK